MSDDGHKGHRGKNTGDTVLRLELLHEDRGEGYAGRILESAVRFGDGTGVERMLIQDVEDSPTGERRLHIYTDRDEDAAPVRTVDVGEFERMQDAVMKVVRMGAEEAGRTEKQPMRVNIHYSVRETRRIEEVSPEVAASVAAMALADEHPGFFEMNGLGGKEYEIESLDARID